MLAIVVRSSTTRLRALRRQGASTHAGLFNVNLVIAPFGKSRVSRIVYSLGGLASAWAHRLCDKSSLNPRNPQKGVSQYAVERH